MLRLSGKEVSLKFREQQKKEIIEKGLEPRLVVVLVGDNPASQIYVNHKAKACKEVGIASEIYKLSSNCSSDELKSLLERLNRDQSVHGILVQLPLPSHIDKSKLVIDPKKDVDALGVENTGLLWSSRPRYIPCTPAGIMKILEYYNFNLCGERAVVVGRSSIVGLPMFQLLQKSQATVTLCHSQTKNLQAHTKEAGLVIVAAGQAQFLGKEDFKKGACIIDVGIHPRPSPSGKKIWGDVRYEELEGHAWGVTPVPEGVGPMTISMLLSNTIKAACLMNEIL